VDAGLIQIPVEAGERLSILWQLAPYVLLTISEILVSTTGLEFAYSQAPIDMKGTLMSFWNLTVTAGNLAVALASALNVFSGPMLFFFYAAFAAAAGVVLGLIARRYVTVDYYQKAAA
jgi:POT family proton-dependent oligopeptide transporter